jgi:hypothetical protein
VRSAAVLAAVVTLLAGCGASAGTTGSATVWVTRDRGARVLLVRRVPAGETAMQALDRVTALKTSYGGRFVQGIDGLEGSLAKQRDWFYFVNGYEADRSAAEYVLHPGDVEWWDFRSWKDSPEAKVVVGAFPEPFLHGYGGKRLPALVVGFDQRGARTIAKALHARVASRYDQVVNTNVLVLFKGTRSRFTVSGDPRPGGAVTFVFSGDWHQLLAGKYRYRYSVP